MDTATAGRARRTRRLWALACAAAVVCTPGLAGCSSGAQADEPAPFAVHGEEVRGTPHEDQAPILRTGRYTDVAPDADRTRHYIIHREQDRSTIHVGFTARPKRSTPDDIVTLELWTMSGTQCGQGRSRDYDAQRQNSLVTVSVNSARVNQNGTDVQRRACATATRLHLVVVPHYGESSLAGAESELVVLEEPEATAGRSLPEPVKASADWGPPMPMEDRERVTPAPSFAQAPRVGPGNYRSMIRPGEVRLYRVELGWGQRLRAQLRIPEPSSQVMQRLDKDQRVDVRLISPSRAEVGVEYTELPSPSASRVARDGATKLTQMTYDVRYRNRNATDRPYVAGASLPGDYYLAVTMSSDASGESYELPYMLDLAVDDTSDGRPPEYAGDKSIAGPLTETPLPLESSTGSLKTMTVRVLFWLGGGATVFGAVAWLIGRRGARLA